MLYLTLRHYEYAVAIAQSSSLSRAAQVLNVSQPSLSNALATIESRLGHSLFLRGRGRTMTITPQGRRFVAEATDVLLAAGRLERSGKEPLPYRQITLGCFSDLAPFVLAPALGALRDALPDAVARPLVESFTGLIDGMIQGRIDICITWDIGLDARFGRRILGYRQPHVFLPQDHPLSPRDHLTLTDLKDHPLILSDDGLSVSHMLRLCAGAGFTPLIAHRAASVEVMRAMAAHGLGIGLSYSAPPSSQSYDGQPIVTRKIMDTAAAEPVILTQLGEHQHADSLATVADAIQQAKLLG